MEKSRLSPTRGTNQKQDSNKMIAAFHFAQCSLRFIKPTHHFFLGIVNFLVHFLFLSVAPLQMSQVLIESPKHCAQKGINVNKLYKKLIFAASILFTITLLFVLVIWLILRPTKPQFSLKEVDIYQLNLSGPNLLNSSIQVTLQSKNPNQKVGVYYDVLRVYAVYKNQQITVDTSLPPFYQGHEDNNILTAYLIGTKLPVASSFSYEVRRDQTAGKLAVSLKVNGQLRWKVGTWVSGKHRFVVSCFAFLPFGPTLPTGPLSSKQGTQCSTAV